MESGLEDRNNPPGGEPWCCGTVYVSMESGLEDRNNAYFGPHYLILDNESQWSPA